MQLEALKDELARFIRWVMRDVTFHKLYACTVQRQDAAGLLDLLPDDESIRGSGLSGVPIKHGLPGFTVKVPVGARVLLGFENGDPRKPYAALWDPGSVTEVVFGAGTQGVARVGDLIQAGGVGTVVSFTPVGNPPGPMATGLPYLISFSPIPPTPVLADPLYGFVTTGRAELKS